MKIGVAGYQGRVGQILVKELLSKKWGTLELSVASARDMSLDRPSSGFFPVVASAAELARHCDCVIDFTTPEATRKNIQACVESHTAMVIGTTGLDAGTETFLQEASATIPILYAANMSIGVNLLLALVEKSAARLGAEWDIEIFESHHRNKIDAPSGTALALGKAAQRGRGTGNFVTDRTGRRKEGDIGYAVSRGGDVVGEHMVTFYGAGERIELGHKASDRSLFAKGALQAAQWLDGKQPGLYSMKDVLGL